MARVWKISFDQRLKVAKFGFGKEHSDASLRQMRHAQNVFFFHPNDIQKHCQTNILTDPPKRLTRRCIKDVRLYGPDDARESPEEGKLEGRFLL